MVQNAISHHYGRNELSQRRCPEQDQLLNYFSSSSYKIEEFLVSFQPTSTQDLVLKQSLLRRLALIQACYHIFLKQYFMNMDEFLPNQQVPVADNRK